VSFGFGKDARIQTETCKVLFPGVIMGALDDFHLTLVVVLRMCRVSNFRCHDSR
jgi:hypothetical protein